MSAGHTAAFATSFHRSLKSIYWAARTRLDIQSSVQKECHKNFPQHHYFHHPKVIFSHFRAPAAFFPFPVQRQQDGTF